MADIDQAWTLARTPPAGWPTDGDFAWVERDLPVPGPGQALTRTVYLSLDPYQWGRCRSGVEAIGDVCHGRTVSQVLESRNDEYQPGDFIFNTNGWQTHGLVGDGVDVFGYMFPRKIDPAVAPISTAVGILGMLGLTAYSGLYVQCAPRAGETVVVSAASGGVGQVAGQIAKIKGCRVIGVAGVQAKCDYVVTELGFDACVSHLSDSYADDLRAACPDGIDIYYENVGGKVYQGVLPLLNQNSRITLCGMISQYGNTDGNNAGEIWRETGAPYFKRHNTQVHGLFVGNYVASHQAEFLSEMGGWIGDGLVEYREDVSTGLETAVGAFSAMLKGGTFGKTLVAVGDDPTASASLTERRARGNVLGH